jgi:hypothetical protein
MSLYKNSVRPKTTDSVDESFADFAGPITAALVDPRNLLGLFKAVAMGMPILMLVSMLPNIAQGLFEKLPKLFKDRKFGKKFQEYCETRAEELKKIPEIKEALKSKNTRKIIAAIKNNMTAEDQRIHREAVKKGFGKQPEHQDFGDLSDRQRDDMFGDLPAKPSEDATGIFPTLTASLGKDKKDDIAPEEDSEELPLGKPAIAEHYLNEDDLIQLEENLNKWFKEKWVRFGPDGKIRGDCAREKSGEGKPKCRPLKSAQAMGKKGRAKAARRKRREDPNPDRSGKAKNVKTEETMNENHICPICGGELVSEILMNEKKDACYYKVKSRYKVWPSAYASGALVKCRKKGAKNWGNKSEGVGEVDEACWKGYHKEGMKTMFGKKYPNCVKNTNEQEELDEKWSEKYKRSIDCSHPKGFSQKAHCQGRNKTEEQIMKEEQLRKLIREMVEELMHEASTPSDPTREELVNFFKGRQGLYGSWDEIEFEAEAAIYWFAHDYHGGQTTNLYSVLSTSEYRPGATMSSAEDEGESVKTMYDDLVNKFGGDDTDDQELQEEKCWECYESTMEEGIDEAWEECYKKTNWEMVPEGEEHTCEGDQFYEIYGDINADAKENLEEAEYRGRKVKLGKPMRGDVKKFKVFVRNPKTGKVKKVNFGDKKMRIKKSNPKRRKSFRARHKCSSAKDRTSARYWSCRAW